MAGKNTFVRFWYTFMDSWPNLDFARRLGYQAYQLRRTLKPRTREAARNYHTGLETRRANFRNLNGSPSEREAWILARLRIAVGNAARLPFWRERFAAAGFDPHREFSFVDFAGVPPLERHEVATAGDALVNPRIPANLRRKMATGGSSGAPTITWTGPEERGWVESAAEFFEHEVGVRRGDRLAYLWGHHLDPVTRQSARDRLEDWLFNRRWFDCFRLSPQVLAEYHRELNDFRPRVMIAYASALASLAETIRDGGLRTPGYPGLGFITGAEKLYPAQREIIESVFGKPVFERYGGRDIGLIGCQLDPAHDLDYSVDWCNVYVEREEPEAQASLLVTKLHADAMPLLRYRTGDIGRFPADMPAHGPVTVLREVVGRELQKIWRPDGTWMHGTVVPHLLKDFAIHEYQLHQRADLSAELSIVPRAGYDETQEAAIRTALEMNLPGISLAITHVERVNRTNAGKWLPVVSDAVGNPRNPGIATVPAAHDTEQ